MTDHSVVSDSSFDPEGGAREAIRLIEAGYWPLALAEKDKVPHKKAKDWQEFRCTPEEARRHFPFACNLGVLLGTPHPTDADWKFIGIDCDFGERDDESQARILKCLPPDVFPTRTGSYQRINVFCMSDYPFGSRKKAKFKAARDHKFPIKEETGAPAEIEIFGELQIMVPPSQHPKGFLVGWIGPSLSSYHIESLPRLSRYRIEEIIAVFTKPKAEIHQLAEAAPGSIHNAILAATGWMANQGWPDQDVHDRMEVFWCWLLDEYGEDALDRSERQFTQEWQNALKGARSKYDDNKKPSVRTDLPAKADAADAGKKIRIARIVSDWWITNNTVNDISPRRSQYNEILMYENGWWHVIPKYVVQKQMADEWDALGPREFNDAYNMLLIDLPMLPPPNPDMVCCLSNTIDVRTLSVNPHSPDDGLLNAVPFDFDPDPNTPSYDWFMGETFAQVPFEDMDSRTPEELIEDAVLMRDTWEEFAGYALTQYTNLQSMLVLVGPTGSGKSTLADTMTWILPEGTISAVPLSKMDDVRNHPAILASRLNISYETGTSYSEATDFINSTVAGDLQSVRRMREEATQVRSSVKLMFLGNRIMKTSDTSGAVQRRMVVILAPNKREDATDRDITVPAKLRREAGAIFSRYVIAGNRVLNRGRFLNSNFSRLAIQTSKSSSDSARSWFEERCEYDPSGRIPNSMLYQDYAAWAKSMGYKPVALHEWGIRLSQVSPDLKTVQIRQGGIRVTARPIKFQEGITPELGVGGGAY